MAQRCFPTSMLWLKLLLQPLWEHSQLCQEWAKHCLQIGSNHRTECLTFPQHMPPDRATRTVCSLRTELCQTHYSARRLVAVSFSGARTSIVTDCCCNSINFYQNTHSTWTSTCCVMLCSIILKTNRVPRILNTVLIPPRSYCQVFHLQRTSKRWLKNGGRLAATGKGTLCFAA